MPRIGNAHLPWPQVILAGIATVALLAMVAFAFWAVFGK